jgi:DNA-binding response OmpR family regulator
VGYEGRFLTRTRTLDPQISQPRSKLVTDDDRFLVEVWGVGLQLVD